MKDKNVFINNITKVSVNYVTLYQLQSNIAKESNFCT